MAGATVTNPAAAVNATANGENNSSNALYLNSFRISAAAGRLAMHVCPPQPLDDVVEFCQLCLSLARGIDCAIASHDVPAKASELPLLFKQVCRRKSDPFTQAAIMVLMISVKSACQSGWFSDKDSEDLFHIADEISSSFCSASDFKCEPNSSLSIISTIMSRFFPLLKMGQIFAFLKVKQGYGTFIIDFHISKSVKTTPEDKIRLLVVQVDNTETSLCLISPPQANFLLNGKGVEKRTNVLMDTGPQTPTIVSHMLKYGTNLLQAVGDFNGNYIVAVAFMTMAPAPDPATLPDYVQSTPESVDPDSEIIVGPSRISLNCPISFKRIKTPVKGQSCKHLQCFDYQNYIDINSRRPSWRCPHCNQHACFTDIRIDQDMMKVLNEVGENVADVILSSDGSWKAIMESDDHTNNPPVYKPEFSKDDPNMLPDSGAILDLTEIDDAMDVVGTEEPKDQKSSTSNPIEVNPTSHMEDDIWSGIYLSTFKSGTSRSSPNLQNIGGISEPTIPTSLMSSPVLPDGGDSSEYGRMPSIIRHAVGRAPVAVQALPAQMPPPQQRPPRSAVLTSQTTSVNPNTAPSNIERQQHPLSRSNSNMVHITPVHSPTPFRSSSGFAGESRQGLMNEQTPFTTNQSQGISPGFSRNNIQGHLQSGLGQARGQHLQPMIAAQRTAQVSRPVQLTRAAPPADSSRVFLSGDQRGNSVPVDLPYDQDWRPMGRMRGSLSGRAYSDALDQYIIRPTQQVQAPRLPVPPNISPQLQVLMANRAVHASLGLNPSSSTADASDVSTVLPQHSSGMQ